MVAQPMKTAAPHFLIEAIQSSSSAPWTIYVVTTIAYLSRGAYTAPCTSGQPPQIASALTHSMHGLDHRWTSNRSQQTQLYTQSLESMTYCKRSPSSRSTPCNGRRTSGPAEVLPSRCCDCCNSILVSR